MSAELVAPRAETDTPTVVPSHRRQGNALSDLEQDPGGAVDDVEEAPGGSVAEPEPREAPVWDPGVLDDLRHQLGDRDSSLVASIVSSYLLQGWSLVARLEAAAAAGDDTRLRYDAHLLRGSTLTVGGARLAALCVRIERDPGARDAVRALRPEFEALALVLARAGGGSPDQVSASGPSGATAAGADGGRT